MLKHVHLSPYSSYRGLCNGSKADTLSLNSTLSFSSASAEPLSSRSSSTVSLQDSPRPAGMPIKVYANVLHSDIEYKTLSISPQTSSKEVISLILGKYRMKHRDPNLFYLTMEVGIRTTSYPIRTILVLDDESKPAQLQTCHPLGHSKFSLQMKRGGLIKVYDSCLMSGSQYKSLLLAENTTVDELIKLLLNCYNSRERPSKFSVYEVCKYGTYERRLHPQEYPLQVQQEWPRASDQFSFQLRRNHDMCARKKLPWIRSLDVAGNVNFRLNFRDEVSPKIIHSPTLKPSYNDYENYFYI